ncbi:Tetraspanin-7 [Papilio xuthus]|uniref:Tetraspanin-7 n=1 Tax=Papilio xuthus TaxID=66420 RepID=A0A194PP14_PAPXU|nr:Tetraspanin-7 [Papilio xuthus]
MIVRFVVEILLDFDSTTVIKITDNVLVVSPCLVYAVGGLKGNEMVGLAMFCGGMWTLFELHKYVDVPSDFGGTAPYLMFGLGAFTLIITSFAFSCIHRKQTLLLYIYSACLACVFMINMGLMISMVCYREALCNGLFEGLTRTIQNYNPETTNIDFAQSTFQCCGVTNYTDWIKSSPTKVIPTSCCIDPTNCVTANYGDVYNKGCYALIREYISNNLPTIIAVAGGMGTFPFFGSFLAYLLGRHIYDLKMYAKGKYAAYVT